MQARGVPAPPRAPPLQTTAHCGADRLNNRALGLDDPQLHPAPRAYPQGRTNARGFASAPAPVTRATACQAGYSPSAHGGTTRLNNWDPRRCSGPTTKHPRPSIDPRGNPARAFIERGAASATVKTRAAPQRAAGHPSPNAHPAGLLRQRQRYCTSGRPYGKGNRPSYTTQPQATATDPPSVLTQGRAMAHSRQGNPPHTESNGSADCLNNRATPSADRALTGRAAGTPQGSERRRHRPSSKGGGQGNKSAKDTKGKAKKANLWELNAHVGLGQPRTRHHAQSGRPGHLSNTVPLA
ncbi:hypothetical protein WOLCODRAFT_159570 [Wolfiporia cocos MD-104 SS10]|uniref:Uncharacterized protein n=1 Tax=Wolfiporia cocos (strain MD-104) TaxID=742152 RepID=A0A2H3JQR2_WOLCO|nr:hypothetical protein WOLCODRAFT_159570 [Wolfiporia cocos MD-104 SS10]